MGDRGKREATNSRPQTKYEKILLRRRNFCLHSISPSIERRLSGEQVRHKISYGQTIGGEAVWAGTWAVVQTAWQEAVLDKTFFRTNPPNSRLVIFSINDGPFIVPKCKMVKLFPRCLNKRNPVLSWHSYRNLYITLPEVDSLIASPGWRKLEVLDLKILNATGQKIAPFTH